VFGGQGRQRGVVRGRLLQGSGEDGLEGRLSRLEIPGASDDIIVVAIVIAFVGGAPLVVRCPFADHFGEQQKGVC